eukprot:SAG31_NODE_1143_length_9694_cov_5.541011_7_plen_115_part_00
MIGLPIFTPQFLQAIPAAALNGVLIFVGVSGLFDLQLWERVQLLYHHPQNFSSRYNGTHPCSRSKIFPNVMATPSADGDANTAQEYIGQRFISSPFCSWRSFVVFGQSTTSRFS